MNAATRGAVEAAKWKSVVLAVPALALSLLAAVTYIPIARRAMVVRRESPARRTLSSP